jgi:hypothetical protein
MALLIIPIGVVLGWLVRPEQRAAWVTAAIGAAALVVLVALWIGGAEISPIETAVLVVGTPIAAWLAYRVAAWRRARRRTASRVTR